MENQSWSKPIIVETRRTGEKVTISSAERALLFMTKEWPTIEAGTAFNAAKESLSKDSHGKMNSETARTAFVEALKEGDIFFSEE